MEISWKKEIFREQVIKMKLEARLGKENFRINVERRKGYYKILLGNREYSIQARKVEPSTYSLLIDNNAYEISAGHSFIIYVKDGYPINILSRLKQVPEVCTIFCATANPLTVLCVEAEDGRGGGGL